MKFLVRAVTRRNVFAIVVGAVVAGTPMFALNFWLEGLIDRKGEAEVGTAAKRAIALAEARVKDAVGALDGLAARGVNTCEPAQVEAMRYAAFSTIPVKEIAIVGTDAETLCTDLGLPLGERTMLSSELLVGAAGYWLDIIVLPRRRTHGAVAPPGWRGAQWRCRAYSYDAFAAAGFDAGRPFQRLRSHRHEAGHRYWRGGRPREGRGQLKFCGRLKIREVRI
jgi:hypothetical protein